MNKWIGMGRLTKDPDVRYSQNDNSQAIARFTLAVDRRKPNADGQREADFLSCVAFGRQAEFCEKYLHLGTKVCAEAHVQTGKYVNKDGNTVYTTDFIIDSIEFAESKSSQNAQNGQNGGSNSQVNSYPPKRENAHRSDIGDGFESLPEGVGEEGLPWN